MEDLTIKCADCGRNFEFTVQEQEFFKDKNFTNLDGSVRLPKRCRNCRRQRKQAQNVDNESHESREEKRRFRGSPDFPHRGSR